MSSLSNITEKGIPPKWCTASTLKHWQCGYFSRMLIFGCGMMSSGQIIALYISNKAYWEQDSETYFFHLLLISVYLKAANVWDSRYHFLSLVTFKYEIAKYALIMSIFNWQYPLSQDYHPLSVLVDRVPNPTLVSLLLIKFNCKHRRNCSSALILWGHHYQDVSSTAN